MRSKTLLLILLLPFFSAAQLPSYPEVVEAFFSRYSPPDDYGEGVVFARKRDGWYVHRVNRMNDRVFGVQEFWMSATPGFRSLTDYHQAEEGTDAKEAAARYLSEPNTYNRYGYERCRYFGYADWARDLIGEFGGAAPASLSDTLIEGLARANGAIASTFLWDQFGGAGSELPKLGPLELPSRQRIDSAVVYLQQEFRYHQLLADRNPSYTTVVGNSVAKAFNEWVYGWMTLEMAGDTLRGAGFLRQAKGGWEVSAYARNYLGALPANALLFTYGDNDTYSLLWEQKVNGFRKDVTVINMSLLGLPRYIDGLKKRGLRFRTPQTIYGNRAYLYARNQGNSSASVAQLLQQLYEGKRFDQSGSDKVYLYPQNRARIAIDPVAFKKIGGAIPVRTSVEIELPNYLTLDQMLLLDIVQTNLYSRPILFTAEEYLFRGHLLPLGPLAQFLPALEGSEKKQPVWKKEREERYLKQMVVAPHEAEKGAAIFSIDPAVYFLLTRAEEALSARQPDVAARHLKTVTSMYGNRLAFQPLLSQAVELYLKAGLKEDGLRLAEHFASEAVRLHQRPSVAEREVSRELLIEFLDALAQHLDTHQQPSERIRALQTKWKN